MNRPRPSLLRAITKWRGDAAVPWILGQAVEGLMAGVPDDEWLKAAVRSLRNAWATAPASLLSEGWVGSRGILSKRGTGGNVGVIRLAPLSGAHPFGSNPLVHELVAVVASQTLTRVIERTTLDLLSPAKILGHYRLPPVPFAFTTDVDWADRRVIDAETGRAGAPMLTPETVEPWLAAAVAGLARAVESAMPDRELLRCMVERSQSVGGDHIALRQAAVLAKALDLHDPAADILDQARRAWDKDQATRGISPWRPSDDRLGTKNLQHWSHERFARWLSGVSVSPS